ncbi:FecR domain-containing protein [Carboxylicivirga sp. RSCT41]|uniref:FecR domain-containing protein n=1 Tax=Carboxylicivirga agarovorans TaxID=3417570 RepID=UPI003D337D6F
MPEKHKIESKILWRVHKEIASPEEQALFNTWRYASSKNKAFFEQFCNKIEAERTQLTEVEIENSWKQVYYSIAVKKRFYSVFKYAAAITIPLMLGLGILYFSENSQTQMTEREEILPGVKKATLFLSDGSSLSLEDNSTSIVFRENELVIGKDSANVLEYIDVKSNVLIYNTIKVPIGGEYSLKLSDGTNIWLNAGSELRYPVNFVGDRREVFLKGEGYFDVAHNDAKPFLVNTPLSAVKVFGTAFNVMSYEEDKRQEVTLVEGKVGLAVNNKLSLLEPGQQAVFNKASSNVAIREVDTEIYTAWTKGELIFDNMPMDEFAKKIARWYDVDFFFANQRVAQKRFAGSINKNIDFEHFMALLEKTTNVKIIVEGRTVLVKELK